MGAAFLSLNRPVAGAIVERPFFMHQDGAQPSATIRQLVSLVQTDADPDGKAIERLLEIHEPLFRSAAANMRRSYIPSSVLEQGARLALTAAVKTFDTARGASFATHLWTYVRHAVLNVIRYEDRAQRGVVSLDTGVATDFDRAEDAALSFEERSALRDMVLRLPAQDRELVGRIYWRQQTQREIAAAKRVSQNAISKQHLRIIGALRQAWLSA